MFVQGKQQPPQTNEPVQVLLTVADTEKHFDCIKGNGKASKLPKKKKSHIFFTKRYRLVLDFQPLTLRLLLAHPNFTQVSPHYSKFDFLAPNNLLDFSRTKTKFKFQEVLSETYKIRNQQMTSNLRTLF